MPNAQQQRKKSLTKFIQVLYEDKDAEPVIIDLKAISHISQACGKLTIYFQDDRYAVLETKNADLLWECLLKQGVEMPTNKGEPTVE